jgi:hypothetical protein
VVINQVKPISIAPTDAWYFLVAESLNKWFTPTKAHHKMAICQKLFSVAHPKACKKCDWLHCAIVTDFLNY